MFKDLPLQDTLVLDFSQFLAGPSCALRLADMGADVIKIERPDTGDSCRQLVIANQRCGDDSALFHTINRNKRSFTADLKKTEDLDLVRQLIQRADVMIHNFRPGVMERIGLDSASVLDLNPRIIYADITGYGADGPWSKKPGQDLLVQSLSGMTWLSGNADQGPVPIGLSIVDMMAGAHLAQGILAALLKRGRTGRGGRVSVSLMETAIDLQFEPLTAFLNDDCRQPERSTINHANVHTAAPYGIYQTSDGYIAIAMAPLDKLALLLDCQPLAEQASDPSTWFTSRDTYKALLKDCLCHQTTEYWLSKLEPHDIWCAPVYNWPELIAQEGFKALDVIQRIEGDDGRTMLTTRCPIRFDTNKLFCARPAPALGAHNDEIKHLLSEPERDALSKH